MNPHYQQTRKSRQNCRHSSISNSFSTSRTNAPRSLSRVKAGTHATSAPNRTHSGLRGETRGVSDGGGYHCPRYKLHVHEYPRVGCQKDILCRFWVLAGGALKEHRKPAEQRCAYVRRCSEASRPRWAAHTYAVNTSIFPAEFFSQSQKTGKKSHSLMFHIHVFDRTA